MRARDVGFVLLSSLILLGCGGGGAAGPTSTPSVAVVSRLVLQPDAASLAVGQTVQLQSSALDQSGAPVPGGTWSYAAADSTIATVGASGLITGVREGSTQVTASYAVAGVSKSTTVPVAVTAAPAPGAANRVTTSGTSFLPSSVTIAANDSVVWEFSGATHNVTFNGAAPASGNIPDQVPGARVSRVFATPGTYAYECTRHAGMTGAVVVQGAQPARFTTLAVAPATPSIAVGATVQLVATPNDQNGSPMAGLPAATWISSGPSVATVSASGLVTGVSAGTATITASVTSGAATHTAVATVTVTAAQTAGNTVTTPNLAFSPATLTVAQGATVTWQFSEATHNVTFLGTAPTGGSIPDQAPGNAVSRTFATPGTYSYECTRHTGMTGQVVVTGTAAAVFTTLDLAPATPALLVGGTAQLTATPRDQNGTAMTGLPAATFSSSATGIASVSPTGLVTGIAAGTATITASVTSGGTTRTATATVTVSAPSSSAVFVTTPNNSFSPPTVTISAGGTVTWQFSGATHNVTFDAAAPAGGNIADQNPGNAASRTFATAGTYAYHCTRHGGMNGTVVVQAAGGGGGGSGAFTALGLTPASAVLVIGGTQQLSATALDAAGVAIAGAGPPTFATSAAAIATVDAAGLVTGRAAGTATITASLTIAGITRTATAAITVVSGSASTVTTPNNTFQPNDLQVSVGATVVWSIGGGTHNVRFKNGVPPGGNIPDTPAGTSVARTFTVAGDYDYECTLHNGMTGRIRVR